MGRGAWLLASSPAQWAPPAGVTVTATADRFGAAGGRSDYGGGDGA